MNRDSHFGGSGRLFPGLVVAGLGVLFLLDNFGIVGVADWWSFWPLLLIALGISKLADPRDAHDSRRAALLIVAGGIFLAANLRLIPFPIWQLWPLILIAAGLMMLFDRDGARFFAAFRIPPAGAESQRPDAIAIFGGFKRRVQTDDFRSASYVALFGGGEVDLRRARIQGESATIEVSAIFGGFEIRVPPNWIVENRVFGMFGGAADETRPPLPDAPDVRTLIVRGSAVFGGVGIKN